MKKRKRTYIKNKMRFTIFIICMSLTMLSLLNILIVKNEAYSSSSIDSMKVVVEAGDTIWSIAKKHNYYNEDVRKIIHEIIELNNIEDCIIKPGDTIKIPVY